LASEGNPNFNVLTDEEAECVV